MRMICVLATALAVAFCLTVGAWGAETMLLENGFYRLRAEGARLTSLEVDPGGGGGYSRNWLVGMGFRGLVDGPDTQVAQSATGFTVRGLMAQISRRIEVETGGVPEKLEPGHTLGQSFQVEEGTATRVLAFMPTWHTSDSGATLTLRRGGPGGEVLARRALEKVKDNSWQEIEFAPLGPGTYYLELSEPQGDVGWWSSRERRYADGSAYRDGQADESMERALVVEGATAVGRAEVRAELDGARLRLTAAVTPLEGTGRHSWPLDMTVRWDNEGYDVSAESVPFTRFFSDTMRYMPVQQLKRWKLRDGRYELNFGGSAWIEADGTGNHDLRFQGERLSLAWHLGGDETTLQLATRPRRQGEATVNQVVIQALPRRDEVPEDWPRFMMPDSEQAVEANTFFYERALTYPPVWGPAAWHEWNAIARSWQASSASAALAAALEGYPMSEEGYVHTWGGEPGWPFPDPSRYDTRHFDTNARFILACWRYAAWTRDREFLRRQAERLRRAMEYQLTVLQGEEGLIVSASKDVTGRHEGVGNNYWDILPFGHLDAFANAVWYASLEAMAQIEEILAEAGGAETQARRREPRFYRDLAVKARAAYNETFWDAEKGRYIGCVDVDGGRHDYGFTFVNLEAMAYGLADAEQASRIYRWMETEPTSTGEADTYSAWIFAPRANTIHNPRWSPEKGSLEDVPQPPWWHFGWRGTPYGDQCQDGGAILYTSYYDLMARCRLLGPDRAWARWAEILGRWRMPDRLCGGTPLFRGEHPQQIDPGAVGLDIPFPESGLVPCWLLYGALGVGPTSRGLEIAPRLPAALPWLEIQNVAYRGLPLTLRSDGREVIVSCAAKGYEFTWRRTLGEDGKVVFTEPPAPVRFPERALWEPEPMWRARWVWLEDPEAPRAVFRHTFTLAARPEAAWLALTADNRFELFVNGSRITAGDDWSFLWRVDLAAHLREGANVLAVACENASGPGGLVAEGLVTLPGGGKVAIATGWDWRVSADPQEGWMGDGFDDARWARATEYGFPPCGPWGDIGEPGPPD